MGISGPDAGEVGADGEAWVGRTSESFMTKLRMSSL